MQGFRPVDLLTGRLRPPAAGAGGLERAMDSLVALADLNHNLLLETLALFAVLQLPLARRQSTS